MMEEERLAGTPLMSLHHQYPVDGNQCWGWLRLNGHHWSSLFWLGGESKGGGLHGRIKNDSFSARNMSKFKAFKPLFNDSFCNFVHSVQNFRFFLMYKAQINHLVNKTYRTAYVIRSGRMALIIHSFCKADLFFHSCGNFSFSGHSDSTYFFHLLAEPSMSRSKLWNCSIDDRAWKKEWTLFRNRTPNCATLHKPKLLELLAAGKLTARSLQFHIRHHIFMADFKKALTLLVGEANYTPRFGTFSGHWLHFLTTLCLWDRILKILNIKSWLFMTANQHWTVYHLLNSNG